MIWKRLFLAVLVSTAMACGSGPDEGTASGNAEPTEEVTSEDVKTEVTEAFDTVRGYTHEQREELVRFSREQLAEIDSKMADLEERMENLPEASRETWRATLETLAREKDALEQRISELGQSSSEAWEDMKSATLSALEELERGINEAVDELDSLQESDEAPAGS